MLDELANSNPLPGKYWRAEYLSYVFRRGWGNTIEGMIANAQKLMESNAEYATYFDCAPRTETVEEHIANMRLAEDFINNGQTDYASCQRRITA